MFSASVEIRIPTSRRPETNVAGVDAARCAVIGAGRIGLPITANLARAGYRVRAHDVRADLEAPVRAAGAQWARTAEHAIAEADVVLTVLPGSPELRGAMLGQNGLLAHLATTADWLDLTSAAPDLASELAEAARRRGVSYLDCAVGGGVEAAGRGELTFYVGGEREVFERNRPLLSTIGSADRVHHLGGHGSGYLVKLLVNLLWFGQALASAEALLLGRAAGLDAHRLADVFENSPASSEFIRSYLPALLEGNYLTSFGLDRCVEELDSLVRYAAALDTPFELSSGVAAIHRAALDRFGPVDGELLGVAHLEQIAKRKIARRGPPAGG